jgi:hypothetical protein
VDLMRYAALNQGADDLASFDGFVPVAFPDFKKLPPPESVESGRYSDEQLFALARFIYSLTPPLNPNKFDALAERGAKVFKSENCVMCHTPPLYTNNKLTLAIGFSPPAGAEKYFDILPISIGTDPDLTLRPGEARAITRCRPSKVFGIAECLGTAAGAPRWKTGLIPTVSKITTYRLDSSRSE